MESDARYVLVGTAVLLFSVALVAAFIWISGVGGTEEVRFYTLYFREHGLDGLQKDSNVTMRGIKVGSVVDYEISPKNVERVKVTVKVDESVPVKLDTTAVIRRNLLTGIAQIGLEGGSLDSPSREEIQAEEDYPIIPEGETELAKLAESIPAVLDQISTMAARFSSMFSEQNLKSIENTLKHAESTAAVFGSRAEQIGKIIDAIEVAATDIRLTSESLRKSSSAIEVQVSQLGNSGTETLKAMQQAVDNLDKDSRSTLSSVRSAAMVFGQETTAAAQNISEAAESFAKTAESFENPRGIISGPSQDSLGPGERLIE